MALRADEVDLGRDRDLVERYQAGDPSAFDDLYQRYFHRLRAYCHRRVGDAHDAEELAQEAFLRALGALPRFAGERRFYPWMTVIAQRLCVDHHRRAGRFHPVPNVDPGTVVDGEHDHLFLDVDLAHLALAIDRLAPRHREVLKLREQEGWTYQQIADHLDVPMTTVEALLHRARKALRREFLAVSGDGRLVALPLLGWLMRSIGSLRNRFAERLPDLGNLAAPMAAGAMTVAMAVAPIIGDRGDGAGDHGVTHVGGSSATSVVESAPAADAAAPVPHGAVAGAQPAAPPTVPAADPSPQPAAVDVGPGAVFLGPSGSAAAEDASAGMPTRADTGDAWLAADAQALIPDLSLPLGGDQ